MRTPCSFKPSRARIAVIATATVLATAPPALAAAALVEAETGVIDNANCGDDGPMTVVRHAEGSGGRVVFHPGTGCSQSFHTSAVASLATIRYFTTGYVGTHCGRFDVTGAISTSSQSICAANDTWITASFGSAGGAGTYTIRWVTEGSTPGWVNAFVDSHTTTGVTPPSQCSDGADNDADRAVDHPADPGCSSPSDNTEAPEPECSDGIDNDGDGHRDYDSDPGCDSERDGTENTPQCSDGTDNDLDGRTDHPADPGCAWNGDDAEAPDPQCFDRVDNDGDGRIDHGSDPDCTGEADVTESPPACADGIDNDLDDRTDHPADPGCVSADDPAEAPDPASTECSDGIDNDGDLTVDWDHPVLPGDSGCVSASDDSERVPQCSDGLDNDGDGATDHPADPGCPTPSDDRELFVPVVDDGIWSYQPDLPSLGGTLGELLCGRSNDPWIHLYRPGFHCL